MRWFDRYVVLFTTFFRSWLIEAFLAIAVGRETFRPDSNSLIESLIRIQSAHLDALSS